MAIGLEKRKKDPPHDRPRGTPFPVGSPADYFDLYPRHGLPEVKLHPKTGYQRHPCVEKQNAIADSEAQFRDVEERLTAIAAYYALTTWLDDNVGRILQRLADAGYGETTTIAYTPNHGDNVGARGLWGKSNFYRESVHIPMIFAGPGILPQVC